MTRRYVAIGLAAVLSAPLIPRIVSFSRHLTSVVVLPAHGVDVRPVPPETRVPSVVGAALSAAHLQDRSDRDGSFVRLEFASELANGRRGRDLSSAMLRLRTDRCQDSPRVNLLNSFPDSECPPVTALAVIETRYDHVNAMDFVDLFAGPESDLPHTAFAAFMGSRTLTFMGFEIGAFASLSERQGAVAAFESRDALSAARHLLAGRLVAGMVAPRMAYTASTFDGEPGQFVLSNRVRDTWSEKNTLRVAADVDISSPVDPGGSRDSTKSRISVSESGWYAVELPATTSHATTVVDFVPRDSGVPPTAFALQADRGGNIGWIRIDQPGTLTTWSSAHDALVHGVSTREVLRHFSEMAASRFLLAASIAMDLVPVLLWLAVICGLQFATHWLIGLLPYRLRADARAETGFVLGIVKWTGAGCYIALTLKDVLGEFGLMAH